MSIRYLSNLAVGIAGAFLIVATQAFADPVVVWLAFAIGVGVMLVAAATAPRARDRVQQAVGALAVLLGAWTVLASLVFATGTAATLAFASSLGFAALALIGLTAHELHTERVVHSIELQDAGVSAPQT